MDKLDGKTFNVVKDNIEKMRELFPEIFTEGKIDMDRFMLTLGEHIEKEKERYEFTWNGKSNAIQLAQKQTTGTLLPSKEDSVDWDTTQNLYLEGDNLEVLRILQNSYRNKVKMIYIDPPYNTGRDFVYKDDFRDNVRSYKERLEENFKSNPETNGRFHTDWLNMMYPRIKVAKNLLKEDGVIFISIDDNEADNLKKVCNEIFGEENFLAQITRVAKTTSFRGNYFAPSKDYIICYAKDARSLSRFTDEVDESQFKKVETSGSRRGEKYRDDIAFYLSTLETRPNQRYFIECPDGSKVLPPGGTFPPSKPKEGDGVWRWNYESYLEKKDLIVFKQTTRSPLIDEHGNQAKWNLYTKSYLNDKKENGNIPRDYFTGFLNRNGTEALKKLDIPFSFAKPVELIKYLIKIINCKEDDIILDFFSGSGTTAQSVLELNVEDDKKYKFILIQLPELTDENSEAFKAGYKYITDIGKERIRRAGEKVLKENKDKENNNDIDVGFKVFKLDETNLQVWDEESLELEKDLIDMIEPVKEGRTQEDVVYEVLLKYGVDLTVPINERIIAGKTVYDVGMGYLLICLERDLTLADIQEIAKLNPARVVFYDEGFKDDTVRTNAQQILKRYKVEDIRVI